MMKVENFCVKMKGYMGVSPKGVPQLLWESKKGWEKLQRDHSNRSLQIFGRDQMPKRCRDRKLKMRSKLCNTTWFDSQLNEFDTIASFSLPCYVVLFFSVMLFCVWLQFMCRFGTCLRGNTCRLGCGFVTGLPCDTCMG